METNGSHPEYNLILKPIFSDLVRKYHPTPEPLWLEISIAYHASGRHYHTLHHLHHLYQQLANVQQQVMHWDTLLFALFYHDIIYDPSRSDNEIKSAALAGGRLKHTGRQKVLQHFLAMEQIFKTDYFRSRYEIAARHNLQRELIQYA